METEKQRKNNMEAEAQRKSRAEESREVEQREIEIELRQFENEIRQERSSQFSVIGGDPGYEYRWFAVTVYNEPIPERMEEAYSRKFEPVKRAEMPRMAKAIAFHNETLKHDYITRGGQILFRRRKEFQALENKLIKESIAIQKKHIKTAIGFHNATPVQITENSDVV